MPKAGITDTSQVTSPPSAVKRISSSIANLDDITEEDSSFTTTDDDVTVSTVSREYAPYYSELGAFLTLFSFPFHDLYYLTYNIILNAQILTPYYVLYRLMRFSKAFLLRIYTYAFYNFNPGQTYRKNYWQTIQIRGTCKIN